MWNKLLRCERSLRHKLADARVIQTCLFYNIAHDLTNILQSNVIFKEIDETFIEMHFEKKVSLNIMKINIEITDHIQEFSRRNK